MPFVIRGSIDADNNYILRSWLKTWKQEPCNKNISSKLFYNQANGLFNDILERFGAIIACNPNDNNQIYAFAIATYLNNGEWVLFWIHTKSIYTNLGIATALVNFIRQDRKHGPICPFVRDKFRHLIKKYDILDAPLAIGNILSATVINSPAKELNE